MPRISSMVRGSTPLDDDPNPHVDADAAEDDDALPNPPASSPSDVARPEDSPSLPGPGPVL